MGFPVASVWGWDWGKGREDWDAVGETVGDERGKGIAAGGCSRAWGGGDARCTATSNGDCFILSRRGGSARPSSSWMGTFVAASSAEESSSSSRPSWKVGAFLGALSVSTPLTALGPGPPVLGLRRGRWLRDAEEEVYDGDVVMCE